MDDDDETTYETEIFLCLTLKYTFIGVYWWTRQRIHNTLIVVDRYLRRMGDKTIPDSAEPRLESFYPPFVAGIDLPHQGVVDSYSLIHTGVPDKRRWSEIDWSQPGYETAFWWRHNRWVTSQSTDPIKWSIYLLHYSPRLYSGIAPDGSFWTALSAHWQCLSLSEYFSLWWWWYSRDSRFSAVLQGPAHSCFSALCSIRVDMVLPSQGHENGSWTPWWM